MDHLHYNLPSGFHTTHNDLKPQNVMVTHDRKHAKLIDFGVSRERVTIQSHTRGATATGTLAYMPPEAFDHAVEATNATDVYAFGVLLYELWTGEVPWAGLGDAAIIPAVTAGKRPEIPASCPLPPAMHCLIELCWHQDPSERPTFATLKEIRTKQGPLLHDGEATAWPKFMRLHYRERDGGESIQMTPTDNAGSPTAMPLSA
jgi:serine/threonine protein kinase